MSARAQAGPGWVLDGSWMGPFPNVTAGKRPLSLPALGKRTILGACLVHVNEGIGVTS